ncbi:hypothetical protein SISSUDRAFT_632821 [Sistotremastrum suecicum HHB10207 ss-3]|uniref:Uncharacterized protein n=1 Tax=Sistotremastrum suecicum HHB10207 ss-3 TaxID=1314776 RepID=A0A165X970_9AGAM|nr:hypothetical protein SISSUDRAFT_632821 [Sistotremastrum suecicum HHB10207 ss-3]
MSRIRLSGWKVGERLNPPPYSEATKGASKFTPSTSTPTFTSGSSTNPSSSQPFTPLYTPPFSTSNPRSRIPCLQYLATKALIEYITSLNRAPRSEVQLRWDVCDLAELGLPGPLALPNARFFDAFYASPSSQDTDDTDEEANDGQTEEPMEGTSPLIWSILSQLYTPLPPQYRCFTLPLSDPYIPSFQSTSLSSSIITSVSLTRCKDLTDDNIVVLTQLHAMLGLDISESGVSDKGIERLSIGCKTLAESRGRQDGGGLRVLVLRGCDKVASDVSSSTDRWSRLCYLGRVEHLCLLGLANAFRTQIFEELVVTEIRSRSVSYHSHPLSLSTYPHPPPHSLNSFPPSLSLHYQSQKPEYYT